MSSAHPFLHILKEHDVGLRTCRHFVLAVMARLVRLSYYDRITAAVPEAFHALMPPPPSPQQLPTAGAPAEGDGADGAQALELATAANLLQMVWSCLPFVEEKEYPLPES